MMNRFYEAEIVRFNKRHIQKMASLLRGDPSGLEACKYLDKLQDAGAYGEETKNYDILFLLAEELAFSLGREFAVWYLKHIAPSSYWKHKGYHFRTERLLH